MLLIPLDSLKVVSRCTCRIMDHDIPSVRIDEDTANSLRRLRDPNVRSKLRFLPHDRCDEDMFACLSGVFFFSFFPFEVIIVDEGMYGTAKWRKGKKRQERKEKKGQEEPLNPRERQWLDIWTCHQDRKKRMDKRRNAACYLKRPQSAAGFGSRPHKKLVVIQEDQRLGVAVRDDHAAIHPLRHARG